MNKARLRTLGALVLGSLASLLWAGCGSDVNEYEVDEDAPGAASASTDGGEASRADADRGIPREIRWRAPVEWLPRAAGQMQIELYQVPGDGGGAQLSIAALPPAGGDLVANIRRWERQLSLEATPPGEISELTRKLDNAHGLEFTLVALQNPNIDRAFRIGIHRAPSAVWFFKLEGSLPGVSATERAFERFLQSVRPAGEAVNDGVGENGQGMGPPTRQPPPPPRGGPPTASGPDGAPPAGMPDMSPPTMRPPGPPPSGPPPGGPPELPPELLEQLKRNPVPSPTVDAPDWEVPEGWQPGPTSNVRVGMYRISGEGNTSAGVTVTALGSVEPLLDRTIQQWRQQAGIQEPVEDYRQFMEETTVGDQLAYRLDFEGTEPLPRRQTPSRITGYIVPQSENRTWFIKLFGDAPVVSSQMDAFERFVDSIEWPAEAETESPADGSEEPGGMDAPVQGPQLPPGVE